VRPVALHRKVKALSRFDHHDQKTLSVVVPCYNEQATLKACIQALLAIQDANLTLEIIIVDDASDDDSNAIARALAAEHQQVCLLRHDSNRGKGAALRTGFALAGGDYVAVQDADLEYDPQDLKRLLEPLRSGAADVVFGSRFMSHGAHRVLYFWHSLGNGLLTLISNIFTDLNLTDIETGYKVFKREILQSIEIQENRFGVEPELVAKVAQMRVRIYEMGISYHGRTYAEGKKIGVKDGFRALYAILKYNAPKAPLPAQFLLYLFVGAMAAGLNLGVFLALFHRGVGVPAAALTAFVIAAALNYLLCVLVVFRHNARWNTLGEMLVYGLLVAGVAVFDLLVTAGLLGAGAGPATAKSVAILCALLPNFAGRKYLVFYEPTSGPWAPSPGPHRMPEWGTEKKAEAGDASALNNHQRRVWRRNIIR
jgi:glycosyltransferase involved in cell wall biosynthesis